MQGPAHGQPMQSMQPMQHFLPLKESMALRKKDASALVGKTIKVGGRVGKVLYVANNRGSSTLHTVDFVDNTTPQTLKLAKGRGLEGHEFQIST